MLGMLALVSLLQRVALLLLFAFKLLGELLEEQQSSTNEANELELLCLLQVAKEA